MSETFKLTGKILHVGEVQKFASGFSKRVIVIESEPDSKYPQKVPFELMKGKVGEATDADEGRTVEVSFNLRGSEYKGKYYANLVAWRLTWINKDGEDKQAAVDATIDEAIDADEGEDDAPAWSEGSEADDGLPF